VIATEDTYAPKQYFEESSIFRSPRIHVLTLPTKDGCSAPQHVLDRLKDYREEKRGKNELLDEDEFWLMLDKDHWTGSNHIENLDRVCQEANDQHFQLAHSNPCFEVWLLLHFEDLNPNDQLQNRKDVEKRMKTALGQFNRARLDLSRFDRENAALAAKRAETLDKSPADRWPQRTGTHVYRLVNSLFALLNRSATGQSK
jgi:hypothetical protein